MKLKPINPPREFSVGVDNWVTLKDCAHIDLDADEQVTFTGQGGIEYDVTRKNWGFYATPSVNGRLLRYQLRTCLVRNTRGQFFVLLVEQDRETDFEAYVSKEALEIVGWLDDEPTLEKIRSACNGQR